jgi:hypothetical protein
MPGSAPVGPTGMARPARFATLKGGFAGLTYPWTTGTATMGLQIEEAIGGKPQMLMDTWQVHRFIPFSVGFLVSKRKEARRRLPVGGLSRLSHRNFAAVRSSSGNGLPRRGHAATLRHFRSTEPNPFLAAHQN